MKRNQALLLIFILVLNVYKQTWKGIPKYYKSLAYVSFINAGYYYLFKRHLLWEFKLGEINWRIIRIIHIFIISPLLVLLFFSELPETRMKRLAYLIKYVLLSTLVEHFIAKRKMIIYKYGWNVVWSGLIYIQMYVFSYLYLKKPKLTWSLSLLTILFYIKKFKLPVTRRLVEGPFLLFQRKKSPLSERITTSVYPYYGYVHEKLQ